MHYCQLSMVSIYIMAAPGPAAASNRRSQHPSCTSLVKAPHIGRAASHTHSYRQRCDKKYLLQNSHRARQCCFASNASRPGSTSSRSTSSSTQVAPTAVVVGGGWAGFGAAYALLQAGVAVTLLDAAEQPGGLSAAVRTSSGRVIEPGIKGFWHQYANIFSLVKELQIGNPFTDWTSSAFYSPQGLEVRAPIFKNYPLLPTPVGNFLYTAPEFRQLPMMDRLTAMPLLRPLLEYCADNNAYNDYDRISAYEMFRSAGVSQRLYRQFLAPILLVTLFAPPEKLSAAAALDALYYFALAHQPDFDVRWCRGPVAERILTPFVSRLKSLGGRILGGRAVAQVQRDSTRSSGVPGYRVTTRTKDGHAEDFAADTVVFAVGIPAMQRIVASSTLLASQPCFRAVQNLSTVDVMAVRLWLNEKVTPPNPSNVLAGFAPDWGATFFDLNTLQDEYAKDPGSVVEVDVYHASSLLPLSDEAMVQKVLQELLPVANPDYAASTVAEAFVQRFPRAVTLFSPGSAKHLPAPATALPGIYMAGDWVAQGPGTHAAKGLCQEKAYVTGLQAGNLAAQHLARQPAARILPGEPDEPHIAAGRQAARSLRNLGRLSYAGPAARMQ